MPNVADFLCVLHAALLVVPPADTKINRKTGIADYKAERISDTKSWVQYCPDHQPFRHFHVAASAPSLSSDSSLQTQGRGQVHQILPDCSRNPCGSHHSWFLSRSVGLRFLLVHWTLKTVQRSNPGLNGKGRKVVPWKYHHRFILKSTLFSLQIVISYPCHRSQTGIWHCSQTLSTPILTAPNKDHLLVYMVMALLKTAQEPSCGHSSLSDSAEAVWV